MIDPVATLAVLTPLICVICGLSSDQPVAQSLRHRLSLRMHLELLINILEVKVDRGGRDPQLGRSGLVVVALDQQLQDSYFVRREIVIGTLGRSNLAK